MSQGSEYTRSSKLPLQVKSGNLEAIFRVVPHHGKRSCDLYIRGPSTYWWKQLRESWLEINKCIADGIGVMVEQKIVLLK